MNIQPVVGREGKKKNARTVHYTFGGNLWKPRPAHSGTTRAIKRNRVPVFLLRARGSLAQGDANAITSEKPKTTRPAIPVRACANRSAFSNGPASGRRKRTGSKGTAAARCGVPGEKSEIVRGRENRKNRGFPGDGKKKKTVVSLGAPTAGKKARGPDAGGHARIGRLRRERVAPDRLAAKVRVRSTRKR